MALSLQDISDRLEITDAVTRYSYGLDQRRWQEWDRAFTADAIIDFSFWGLEPASPADFRKLFSANDSTRISGQHLLSNQLIWLEGDTARTHAEFNLTTLSRSEEPGLAHRVRGGGYYEDELVRTADGWRIRLHRGIGKWTHQDEIPWN
jgi:SnoaL-like domain